MNDKVKKLLDDKEEKEATPFFGIKKERWTEIHTMMFGSEEGILGETTQDALTKILNHRNKKSISLEEAIMSASAVGHIHARRDIQNTFR